MAYNRWGILLCAFVSLSCVVANVERVRKITYVVHPGPPGIYHHQQQKHSVPLGNLNPVISSRQQTVSHVSTQERTRRMSRVSTNPSLVHAQQPQQMAGQTGQAVAKVTRHFFSTSSLQQDVQRNPSFQQLQQKLQHQGVNVCGGKCCHGWSKSSGSERCTKPNCTPPCQNGGMCLRPHLCVCKPGTKGKVCEESATQDTSSTVNGGYGQGYPAPPSRPIPQQAAPQSYPKTPHGSPESSSGRQVTLALKQKPHIVLSPQSQPQMIPPQTLTMNLQNGQTQQFMIKPKYYSKSKNSLSGEQSTEGSLPLRANLDHLASSFQLGNQTGRIKVVFTPSICKVTCTKGHCQNSCEKGNTTTLISENGHAADTLTSSNFRVVICHLPCINGGQCTARDKCHCPPNFTGKLCQIPVQNGNQQKQYSHQQHTLKASGSHVVHSTHTLPLTVTGQQGIKVNFPPNLVNIHVKHPPEASVQFHQVSRVESSSSTQKKESQIGQTQISYHGVQKHQLPHTIYPHQQTIPNVYPVSAKSQLGRCFQETTGSQCGKPLPGLHKQDDCCGSVGSSWGFSKCMKCPKKITYTGYSQYVECPQGYKRMNATFCQDINECRIQNVCPNGECLNTVGSYRCTCKLGFVPDPTLSACIAENPLSEEKGPCYRLVNTGKQCMHPLSVQLTRQLCCCSVGKAWGPHCEKCPVLGTAAFKEICPGGMGYTMPVVRFPAPRTHTVQPPVRTTRPPVITKEEPIEALSVSERNDPDSTSTPEQRPVTLGEKPIVDRRQPQHSLEISTINLHPQFPVVVEKSSPPVPVAIAPDVSTSSASQVIAPTQVTEINECTVDPDICLEGQCVNLPEGYTCVCFTGFTLNDDRTKCVDINECSQAPYRCSHGHCENNIGSFLCVCHAGYMANEQGTNCVDVNECLQPNICENGRCINTAGSYRCEYCTAGFRMNRAGQCEDINECLTPSTCPYDRCVNNPGSYSCVPCAQGYRGFNGQCHDINECQEDTSQCTNGDCFNLEGSYKCLCRLGYRATSDEKQCIDIDECQAGNLCLNGHCQNIEGSFTCSCNQGYQLSASKEQCDDIDECQDKSLCGKGQCRNTLGYFTCICDQGYKLSSSGDQCEDIDECQEYDDACQGGGVCHNTEGSFECSCPEGFKLFDGRQCQDINECEQRELCVPNGECRNTPGSFYCICEQGFAQLANGSSCADIDECINPDRCGSQGICENAEGSYRCFCFQGYQDSLDGQGCVDVNECEILSGICGEARCDNEEGSFLCLCADDDTQEYDPMIGRCRYRDMPDSNEDEKKECYYNLNDVNFCGNVLAVNVTKQECCCTLGAGWGDNCEIFPCPVIDSDEYLEMCPKGKGFLPSHDTLYEGNGITYQDADECMLFGKEICKNGFCLNTESNYECYCKQGTYYDPVKFQCSDNDECQDPSSCINGECINTDGSYSCFCTHPMVLDVTGKRCIRTLDAVEPTEEADVFQDLCWQDLNEDFVCSRPLVGKQTTYTECCCLYGEAWGMQCALCPMKDSEDYAQLCNIPVQRYRQPYGEDALDFSEHYIPPEDPYILQEGVELRKYEELQAEECGILNGCENGRCVRVQEGYTCDCFDGFHLNMLKMTCDDVNECSELNNRMSLCKNAKCINTEGSYKCVCLPGYVPSDKPNYCTALNSEKDHSDLE